jgi:hypothetical protein
MLESLTTAEGKVDLEKSRVLGHSLGLIRDAAIEHVLTAAIESEYVPAGVKKFNAKFFEFFQLKRWTDFVRATSITLGRETIKDYARKAQAGIPQAMQQLRTLGLTPQDVLGKTDDDLYEDPKFRTAIDRWTNEATLRPGADTRPARLSDPRLALVAYLKDFPWAIQARTLSYVMEQSKLQPTVLAKMTPWISAAIPMMAAGAIGAFTKDFLTKELIPGGLEAAGLIRNVPELPETDPWQRALRSIKKSGMLGVMEMPLQFVEGYEHRGIPWIGIVSPAAQVFQDMALRGTGRVLFDKIPGRALLPKPVRDAIVSYDDVVGEE